MDMELKLGLVQPCDSCDSSDTSAREHAQCDFRGSQKLCSPAPEESSESNSWSLSSDPNQKQSSDLRHNRLTHPFSMVVIRLPYVTLSRSNEQMTLNLQRLTTAAPRVGPLTGRRHGLPFLMKERIWIPVSAVRSLHNLSRFVL